VSDDLSNSGPAAPPPAPSAAPPPAQSGAPVARRSSGRAATWSIAAIVVLALAIASGLFTAWVVASMRAVPGPVAGASATPLATVPGTLPSASASASSLPSDAPRRTPTPAPTVEVTAAPFVHIVQKGESLTYIAGLYQVDPQDIIDLNGITNPNRIAVGQALLIPGYGIQPTPKPPKTPR
jgi:LysM repeat protein